MNNRVLIEGNIGYLITKNKVDFKESGIIICTAKEYLAIRSSNKESDETKGLHDKF